MTAVAVRVIARIGFAIRRGLRPLYELSDDVHAVEVEQQRPLGIRHPQVEFRAIVDAAPDSIPGSMEAVARSVVADELRKERLVVFEKLRRLGVQCLEAPYNRVGTDLINRYLAIKQREMI